MKLRPPRNALVWLFIMLLILGGAALVTDVALEQGMNQGVIATTVLALGIGLLGAILLR